VVSLQKLRWVFVLVVLGSAFGQTANRIGPITSALQTRQFDEALHLLEPALKESPQNAQLWMMQGLAFSGKGQSKSALHSFQAALKISPDYLPALEGAAQLEYDAGSAAAIPFLRHVLRLRPDDVTSHAMLAVLSYKQGDCPTAVEHFNQSNALIHSQPGALQAYGACLLKLNQTDKALPVYEEILGSNPDDPHARRALAATQLKAGHPPDALTTIEPLLTASDPEIPTLQLASAIYEANKDTPNAVRVLRDAIVRDPRNVLLYVDFANLAMTHQSFQTGVDMVDAGLKLQPGAAQLYLARGVLYVQLANFDKAEADFEKAEQLDPQQALSAAAQGMIAEEKNQNDPDRALATVRSKITKKPSDAFLWYLQAAILAQKAPEPGSDEFQQALQSGKKAVALQPSLTAAHNILAKLYLDSGQIALAVKECRLVLERNPADQTALYHLVLALRRTDDHSEIPDLLKRLAKARQDATREEAENNRYKLVVSSGGSSE